MKRVNDHIYQFVILSMFLTIFLFPVSCSGNDLFSHLKLTEISVKGHKLHIKGETDLPKGAMLNVHVGIPGLSGKNGKVKVHVNSQRFFVQIDLPKKGAWHGKKAQIKVLFRPDEQGPKIRTRVGSRGEKLAGAKVKTEKGKKYLEESSFLLL
jgi:hypothetical protein